MQPTSTSTKGLPSKFPNNKLSRFEGIWATCTLLNLALCRRNLWLLSKVVHQRFAIGRITKIKAQPECCILVSMFDLMKSHKHQLASLCSMYKWTAQTSLDNSPLSFALTRLICACVYFVFENKTKCKKMCVALFNSYLAPTYKIFSTQSDIWLFDLCTLVALGLVMCFNCPTFSTTRIKNLRGLACIAKRYWVIVDPIISKPLM